MTTLPDIELDQLAEAQQTALLRLMLYISGQVHALVDEVLQTIERKIRAVADDDGSVPSEAFFGLRDTAEAAWATAQKEYETLLKVAMRHAAAIPYGVLAIQHDARSADLPGAISEARLGPSRALAGDLDDLVAAANSRVVGGLTLSRRLWQLNTGAQDRIEAALLAAVANGSNAVQLARLLEAELGAGAECPRWTWQRLRLSKKRIAAGDTTGLISGSPCAARGVAYTALRLAHTELTTIHQLAAAQAAARSPWVEAVQIRLSGAHPKPDVCDQHADGGPNGGGIYPVGDQPMPPYHPMCLCYQATVSVPAETFRGRLAAYVAGGADDAIEDYRAWLGVEREALAVTSLIPLLALALAGWLGFDPEDMEELTNADPAGA